MNNLDSIDGGLNRSLQILLSNDPPPGAPSGWPGCTYQLPLPPTGSYGQATKWIWKTVPPFLILLGTVGNILTALVIFRNFGKLSSTAVYLLALAVTDTLFLYNAPLRHLILKGFGFDVRNISNTGCKISTFLTYTSFHTSAWILVAVTVERVLSVLWPYKVKRRCTKRSALVVTLAFVIAIFLMDSHILYGFGKPSVNINKGLNKCMPIYEEYLKFFDYQWAWIHFIVGFATPFLFIVIGNILVIRGLRKMRMRQRWMDEEARNGQKLHGLRHGHRERTLMITLILLNTIFFISQTPIAIYIVYFPYFVDDLNKIACSDFKTYMEDKEKLWFWDAITQNFGYLNASVNFVLYVISGSRFRREIASLLMCSKEVGMHTRSLSASQDSSRRHHQHPSNVYCIS